MEYRYNQSKYMWQILPHIFVVKKVNVVKKLMTSEKL